MASIAFQAQGLDLNFNSTDVSGVRSVTLPSQTRGDVEYTDADSGGDRQFFPGMRDNGTVELEMIYLSDDAGQTAIRTNFQAALSSSSLVPVTITLPAGATSDSTTTTITFDGYITDMGGNINPTDDEVATFTFSIKASGGVTEATA